MKRPLAALACSLFLCAPASAMVGGAPAAPAPIASALVLIVGSGGTFCSGALLTRDLALTAAHCVVGGAEFKIVEFDAARNPVLKDITRIARHPQFDAKAAERHRVTADVALLKLAAPLKRDTIALAPPGNAVAPGDTFTVAGLGVAKIDDGKSGGSARMATLVATGKPGTLQIRLHDPATKGARGGLGACTGDSGAPAFRDLGGRLGVIGVVSWSTGPNNSAGCGGLTGVTPLVRYRDWVIDTAKKFGSALP